MSPAGYWNPLHAAVEAGADTVYFGLKQQFPARARVGFTPEVMRTLHARGVKGYVTFNTLVFDDELSTAVRMLKAIARRARAKNSDGAAVRGQSAAALSMSEATGRGTPLFSVTLCCRHKQTAACDGA